MKSLISTHDSAQTIDDSEDSQVNTEEHVISALKQHNTLQKAQERPYMRRKRRRIARLYPDASVPPGGFLTRYRVGPEQTGPQWSAVV